MGEKISNEQFSKKSILIVDDDEYFRRSVVRIAKVAKYHTIEASNGKEAVNLLGTEKIDLIISDIRMPQMHGIELFHHVQRHYKNIPFIIMTGFSEIIETAEAYELGVHDFLTKPFTQEVLLEGIKNALNIKDENENMDEQYSPIEVEHFIRGTMCKFPIFLRLSASKYVKIAHHGEDLSEERIESLKNKQINYLYIKQEDFKFYSDFSFQLSQKIVSAPTIPRGKKILFLNNTTKLLLRYSFQQTLSDEVLQQCLTTVEETINLVTDSGKNSDLFYLLESLSDKPGELFAHSLAVSMISSLIAREAEWYSQQILIKVIVGALFHDIGKKDFPQELLEKPYQQMDDKERRLFESHPKKGAKILSALPNISPEIAQVVLHHHERCGGGGYPEGLAKARIQPLALIVAVANEFCNWFMGAPGYQAMKNPYEILTMMESNVGSFSNEHINGLKKQLKPKK